jgi:Sec7-like guanine-nucleotide exchange factor
MLFGFVQLPGESQQIDAVVKSFAQNYYHSNIGIDACISVAKSVGTIVLFLFSLSPPFHVCIAQRSEMTGEK